MIVTGERNKAGYLTTSKNITLMDDYRGEVWYSTVDGSEITIMDLGKLPDNITKKPKPDQYHEWDKKSKIWVEQSNAESLRLADKRSAMPELTRVKFLTALYQLHKIKESDILALIDKVPDEDTRYLMGIEFGTNNFQRKNPYVIQIAKSLGFTDADIDELWEVAVTK